MTGRDEGGPIQTGVATATSDVAVELMDTVSGLRRVVRRRLRAAAPEPPLRGAHVELLRVVGRRPGIGIGAVARSLHLADNSVSTLANQLVRAGLLRRRVQPGDRRAAHLELTEAARERMLRWRDQRARLVGTALAGLPGTDAAAIAAALPALRRLLTALEEKP